MKLLTVFSMLQIAVIIALLLKVIALDKNLTELALAHSGLADTGLATLSVADNSPVANEPVLQPDPEQLRTIVREEIASALLPFSTAELSRKSSSTATDANEDSEENQDYQNELKILEDELDYYISQGSISDQEMAALQLQLARLDQSGRKHIMQKLVRALNSGDLSGRF